MKYTSNLWKIMNEPLSYENPWINHQFMKINAWTPNLWNTMNEPLTCETHEWNPNILKYKSKLDFQMTTLLAIVQIFLPVWNPGM